MLMAGHGHAALGDFSVAFLVVTAVSLSATWWNAKLPPEAGSDMSGHKTIRRTQANKEAVQSGQIRPV